MAKLVDGKIVWEKDDCCGDGWFQTTERDPFLWACRWHDLAYQKHKLLWERDRKDIDREFLCRMLLIAKSRNRLRLRAYTYYGLVRTFGWIAWNREETAL
jgi:hypothetical protein